MDFEKIFVSLDENHRRAIFSIILCSLILHSVFYVSSDLYRDIEWYSQLLFSLGVSVCYVGTFTVLFIWLIKTAYIFYLSVPALALPAIFGFFIASWTGVFDFTSFAGVFGCCFIITLFYFIFKIIKEMRHNARKTKEEKCNDEI